jgi:hypothetical protein
VQGDTFHGEHNGLSGRCQKMVTHMNTVWLPQRYIMIWVWVPTHAHVSKRSLVSAMQRQLSGRTLACIRCKQPRYHKHVLALII